MATAIKATSAASAITASNGFSPQRVAVIEALIVGPGTSTELAERASMPERAAYHHLWHLRKDGLARSKEVSIEEGLKSTQFEVLATGKQALASWQKAQAKAEADATAAAAAKEQAKLDKETAKLQREAAAAQAKEERAEAAKVRETAKLQAKAEKAAARKVKEAEKAAKVKADAIAKAAADKAKLAAAKAAAKSSK